MVELFSHIVPSKINELLLSSWVSWVIVDSFVDSFVVIYVSKITEHL